MINMDETIKMNVEVNVTEQAKLILSNTEYSVNDFIEWSMIKNKISLGGHNVMLFLEVMAKEKKRND